MNIQVSASKTAAPVLRVEGLSKQFEMHHLKRTLFAFENIDFELGEGEFILLKGENGAGKSTLLRTLYRSYLPRAGHAYYHTKEGVIDLASAADVDVAVLRRREIGFVTQFLNARPRVPAEEVVAEPLRLAGTPHGEALVEARRWLAAFGVKKQLWAAYPSTFSGGEQQKVNLACALILPQRLLLLDEPTASLDRAARQALVERLGELKAAGVAMIGVFHHQEDVDGLVDREIHLKAIKIEDNLDERNG
ncbi:alpha-D-ribose 1-methylphosphonate 5-triphosphate synthase subunit PhnL [Ensifer sp. SEMIA 135]|uniref:phosphonate C-P lyase system protein PhnL n=1 Tax=Rhizobium meliloti TaxID=382 RepID=UPI000FD73232|nr:ATP-binding cassette domain-containing protein [Sinorhizobium meliloti]RVL21098.1 ATP-binding cassette domain-containing protein [Sinorhizobium meliloti]RVP94608.1 ATP-binding cassette domain-containing protein [Sinorhizobium meliloti]TWA88507.1 alpha-D-ribose 1-methylphosphonate 5-triphosphate synthase subunit PhnL [Ensifer sp. SEMIA 134]TWB24041.1 alpha-D-ribose 1-methylphosphonate 5-triphosphate synthase subunit PhnL [Ensifer sp. SEMIA 135]